MIMNNSRFSAIREETVHHEGSGREGPPLQLYLTSGCHLCAQAEALLQGTGLSFEAIEIADDEALVEQYGMRIPVLRWPETGQELDWPFAWATVRELLKGAV
jgi:hypothetical protein